MRPWGLILAALLPAGVARAQDGTVTPTLEARLRYEHVAQDGLPEQADALTLRLRPGLVATRGRVSALVEGEAVVVLGSAFNDGLNGRTRYPLVADPANLELNRAQLRYQAGEGALTAGRQRIDLADQRFVGSAPWRQSEQTFDAVRLQWGRPKGLSLDVTYAASVRTVNGRKGFGARPIAMDGDNLFALLSHGSDWGTLTGFAYLVDQDEAAVQGYRLSSQTWGVRVAGNRPIGGGLKLGYAATLARQSDHGRNPNRYAATYALGEASVARGGTSLTAGYEVLGADRGVALTSVQTPLGALFRYNGWAGKFATTPPDGLHDRYVTLAHGWKGMGRADAIGLGATWHGFASDRLARHYGDELDLLASVRVKRTTLSARYAAYRADRFATDTDKVWLQLDVAL
jgi:hypothetical protein